MFFSCALSNQVGAYETQIQRRISIDDIAYERYFYAIPSVLALFSHRYASLPFCRLMH